MISSPDVKECSCMSDDIKIYVAHSPNSHMERIDAPFFYNVIAGSDLQEGTFPEDMAADNSGDNISRKNRRYCELTVQYWAWKNEQADYYGFCHYRRLFSFGTEREKINEWGVIGYNKLDKAVYPALKMDRDSVSGRISGYDILVAEPFLPDHPSHMTVYEHYEKFRHLRIKDLDLMLEVIDRKYPFLTPYAKHYMTAEYFYPCNMFIMKRELFFDYAEKLFSVLDEVEKDIDMTLYSREGIRTMGHLGERFLGIYYEYIKAQGKYSCGTLQTALFNDAAQDAPVEIIHGDNVCPVVFAADQSFVPMLGVSIRSLIDNASEANEYEIYIFYRDIRPDSVELLKGYFTEKNVHLHFVNVLRHIFRYRLKAKDHITTETYYRCLIPELLKGYDKVLYLDCDIIIRSDIAKLFETEMSGCLIGAAMDPDFMGQCNGMNPDTAQYCESVLKIDPNTYFQAGVLLFNISEFNASSITARKMFDMADTGIYRYSDQDILNILCNGRVSYFDMSWNVMYDFDRYRWEYVIKYAPEAILKEYENARLEPRIIHYAGYIKPWHTADVDYGTQFWEVARKTPFYEMLLHEMMKYTLANRVETKKYNEKLRHRIKLAYVRLFPEGSRRREWIRKYIVPHAKKSLTDYISIEVE